MESLISVVVTTYNRSRFLKLTLDSIINQTYKNIEILIVDDGSTDDTKEVVNSFKDNRIRYIGAEKNSKNLSHVRNIGIAESKGAYVAFCDDDDLWIPEKLEIQSGYIKGYDLVSSNAICINQNNELLDERFYKFTKRNFLVDTKILLSENIILASSMLFKKQILDEEKFDEMNLQKNQVEDWEFFLRLSLKCKILFINKDLVSYRIHQSLSRSDDNRIKYIGYGINTIKHYNKVTNFKYNKFVNIGVTGSLLALIKLFIKNSKIDLIAVYSAKFLVKIISPFTFYYYFNRFFLKRNILY